MKLGRRGVLQTIQLLQAHELYMFSRLSESHAHRHWTHIMRLMVLLWLALEVHVAAASSLPLETLHSETERGLSQTFVFPGTFDKQLDLLGAQHGGLHGRELPVCVSTKPSLHPTPSHFIAPMK